MSQHANNICRSVAILAMVVSCGLALAAPPAPNTAKPTSPVPSTAPAAAAAPTPMTVAPADEGLSAEGKQLSELRRETARSTQELQLLTAQGQVQTLRKQMGQVTSGTSDIPELVGLQGARGHMVAQFLSGKSILNAAEGQWVTPDWRLIRVLPNGVVMKKRAGGDEKTILYGHEPINGASTTGLDRVGGAYPVANTPVQSFPMGQARPVTLPQRAPPPANIP